MHRFTIGHEKTYCTHVWRCVLGTAPTMGQVNAAYGGHTASAWLVPFLWDVSEFCGCKEKFTKAQMEELAYVIVDGYHWLKVTEMMLFFWWFSLKSWLSIEFSDLFSPAGDSTGDINLRRINDAQIRLLTGGDITKEETVFNSNARRALTELNEKAREAKEREQQLKHMKR